MAKYKYGLTKHEEYRLQQKRKKPAKAIKSGIKAAFEKPKKKYKRKKGVKPTIKETRQRYSDIYKKLKK